VDRIFCAKAGRVPLAGIEGWQAEGAGETGLISSFFLPGGRFLGGGLAIWLFRMG